MADPATTPLAAEQTAEASEAMVEALRVLGLARGLTAWHFDRLIGTDVPEQCAEVGSGIGTFTRLLLDRGAERVIALEPDQLCRRELSRELGTESRLEIVGEGVPGSAALAASAGALDLVLCQNVLEHIEDDRVALTEMRASLRPGGVLALLVPAYPRLYGSLDRVYGHYRRYTAEGLETLMRSTGFEIESLGYMNMLGIPGWWLSNKTRRVAIGAVSLRLYELLLRFWRPLEDLVRPRAGLSLVVRGRRPA